MAGEMFLYLYLSVAFNVHNVVFAALWEIFVGKNDIFVWKTVCQLKM
jgi:hypothetical protein